MDSGRFYHIYVVRKGGVSYGTLESKMNLALDWFRYDQKNWIVYSTSDTNRWMSRLKPLVKPDGNIFICELKINNRNGWMSKKLWEWIKKAR